MTLPSDSESWSSDDEREIMSEEKKDEKKPVYLLQYVKQTSMLGEQVSFSINMPGDSTEEDLSREIIKLGNVLDNRMRDMNKTVKKLNKESGQGEVGFEQMGIDPGTVYIPQEEK